MPGFDAVLSADGSVVAFYSQANDLVVGDFASLQTSMHAP
jgi:hypothetical protein